jgi:hypothetical protein
MNYLNTVEYKTSGKVIGKHKEVEELPAFLILSIVNSSEN